MNSKSVHHNRNQCPAFFRVPAPITSPAFVCPLSAKEVSDCQQDQPYSQSHFVDVGQFADIQLHSFFIGFGRKNHQKQRYNSEYHRSEEHTSELQSRENLVCRLLLEKKKVEGNRMKR